METFHKNLQEWLENSVFNLQKENECQPKSILTAVFMNFQIICCVLVFKRWEKVSLRKWVQKREIDCGLNGIGENDVILD